MATASPISGFSAREGGQDRLDALGQPVVVLAQLAR